ncbi:MAG: peptide chain release factor N(5)-glutamine methyltransferase [Eubacteriales bacterium]|nr:peptide chain release factor N(5)-glutamine methyltransferase [Eubacteriales bacterium]
MRLRDMARDLSCEGVPPADVNYLAEDLLGIRRIDCVLSGERELTDGEEEVLRRAVARAKSGEPLQYITGIGHFMGLKLAVGPGVLIPRPETELLAHEALRHIRPGQVVLDLCTGSGALAIALAKAVEADVTATDISETALNTARMNAEKYDVSIRFMRADFTEGVDGIFDVIVSNPPYIASRVVDGLEPRVRCFEPRRALDGGADGLAPYRRILSDIGRILRPGGYLLFEIGYDQGPAVGGMMAESGFADVRVKRDWNRLDRVVSGRFRERKDNV